MPFPPLTLWRKLRELRHNEQLTREQLEAAKLLKFRRLVRHASRHSPYYAQLVREHGIDLATCVPADFPVLTKAVLMANFDRVATDRRITRQAVSAFLDRSVDPAERFLDGYRVIHTSGSSGEVGYFVYSENDWARGIAQQIRAKPTPAARPKGAGKFRFAYYAAVGGHFAGVTMATSATSGPARFFVDCQLLEVNHPLPDVVAALNAYQPEVLMGYTTALKMLAAEQVAGRLRLRPTGLGCVGEALTPADRRLLQQAFGCGVTGSYASSEHLFMGRAGPDSECMQLRDDDLMYEFHPDHTLVTNLFNHTLPLIRYRMSDVLRPLPPRAGSPYLDIASLVGRSEHAPRFTNEQGRDDFISPHTINEIFVPGVTGFQMQVQDRQRFTFAVCLEPQLDQPARAVALEGLAQRLRAILSQKGMSNVHFALRVIPVLPLNPRTRKFQLIVGAPAETASDARPVAQG